MLSRMKFEIEPLVAEMLDRLPNSVWSSKTSTFFDPAIGGGQFVRAIEQQLREHGHSDANIRSRVFGFEESNLHIRFAVNKYNLVGQYGRKPYEKFFELDNNMKFDVIVGNPPYQVPNAKTSGGSGTLWKKFVLHVFDHVATDGYVAFVTPVCPYYTKDSIGKKFRAWQTHAIWTDQSKYFPKIGSTFTSWIIQNTPKYKLTSVVDLGYDIDLSTARYRLLPPIANQILAKLDAGKKSLGTYKVYGDTNTTLSTTYSAQTPYKVRWASIKTNNGYRYTNSPGAYYTHSKVAMSFSGNPDFKYFDGKSDPIGSSAGMSGYILVKDAAEGANLIDSINLSINKFERKLLKSSGAFTNAPTWQTIAFDIKQPVTDAIAYSYLKLSKEEIAYITDTILP